MLFNSGFVPFFEMRFNFQISKYFSRENDTVQIFDRFFFFRKASKPRSSEATHLFCRQTRIYCLSRKTIADKYIFLTEIYIFIWIFGIALFFKLLRRAFWNMILQHQHLSEGRLHFKLLHLRKMLKRHDLATKMRWATVQEKEKWTVTKKSCPYSGIKKWKWNTSGNYCPCAILNLIKERIEINFGTYA